jgi:putative ABC transport system permease protein
MIALDELWYRKGQFALIGLIVTLVAYLVFMINALGAGLLEQAGAAVKNLDADALVFRDNANLSFQQSELAADTVRAIQAAPGVRESSALGYVSVQPSLDPQKGSIAFIGFEPGTISEPALVAGRALEPGENGAVLADRRFLEERDLEIGDMVELSSRLQLYTFEIVGEVDEGPFFFQDPVWGSMQDWRVLKYGDDPGAPAATLVMVSGAASLETQVPDAVPGTEAASPAETFNAIPGVGPQQNTANAIEGFGLIIGAMVIGVFFYVLTVQKTGQIGILKAIGASSWFVFLQLLIQVLVVSLIGLAIALPLTVLTVNALSGAVPLLIERRNILITVVLLLAAALVGVLFSGRRIPTIDPLIALGQQQ